MNIMKYISFFWCGLIFSLLQPLASKQILPIFGSTPMAWNTLLLLFYAFIPLSMLLFYWASKLISYKPIYILLGILSCLSLLCLPFSISSLHFVTANKLPPLLEILISLVFSYGLPLFICFSMFAALVSEKTENSANQLKLPFAFFFIGLSFGWVANYGMEPYISLSTLNIVYAFIYSIFIGLTLVTLGQKFLKNKAHTHPHFEKAAFSNTNKLKVCWFSAISFAFLIGFTNFISLDLASTTRINAIPALTFAFSFSLSFLFPNKETLWKSSTLYMLQILSLIGCTLALFQDISTGTLLIFSLFYLLYATTLLRLHKAIESLQSNQQDQVLYFFFIGLGFVLGALFMNVLAPILFLKPSELGLVITAVAFTCLPIKHSWPLSKTDLFVFILFCGLILSNLFNLIELNVENGTQLLFIATISIALYSFRKKTLLFGASTILLVLYPLIKFYLDESYQFAARSFYGTSIVQTENGFINFTNGNTLHGRQYTDITKKNTPTSYYHPNSPIGLFLSAASIASIPRIGVVGLGTGTLATYTKAHQHIDFFEIDPVVQIVAQKHFSYLKETPATNDIIIGDGRISLEKKFKQKNQEPYNALIIDAFSSDVIPTHLLTLEAADIYAKSLANDGILFIHTSNRYYDLKPVISAIAQHLGLALLFGEDEDEDLPEGSDSSQWYALTNNEDFIQLLDDFSEWEQIKFSEEVAIHWTDNFANPLQILRH